MLHPLLASAHPSVMETYSMVVTTLRVHAESLSVRDCASTVEKPVAGVSKRQMGQAEGVGRGLLRLLAGS